VVAPRLRLQHHNPPLLGGSSIWSWLWSIFLFLLFLAAAVLGLAFAAYKGYLPDWVLRYVPFLENMRYHSMRSNFQSLAQDFGLSGATMIMRRCTDGRERGHR